MKRQKEHKEASYRSFRFDDLPLCGGKVAAGFPSEGEDFVDNFININQFLIPHPAASFVMRVTGQSMRDAGIMDGDYIIVDKGHPPRHGDIVIAIIHQEFTLKRFEKGPHYTRLVAANPNFPDIPLHNAYDAAIWGVVTGSFRRYKSAATSCHKGASHQEEGP